MGGYCARPWLWSASNASGLKLNSRAPYTNHTNIRCGLSATLTER